jgi:molecular chaperone GrpE (heat shock protein)
VRLPGQKPEEKASRIREVARDLAFYGAQASGIPPPMADAPTAAFFATIRSAIDALNEMRRNSNLQASRTSERASADQADWKSVRTAVVLSLADLRHQLRARDNAAAAGKGDVSDMRGLVGWVTERLDETLATAGVSEFVDDGRLNVSRHHVVGRMPSNAAHPDGTIASSARPGLLVAGEVLRPQQVIVYSDSVTSYGG